MTVISVRPAKQHMYTVEFDDGDSLQIDKTVWEHSGYREKDVIDEVERTALCERSDRYRAKEKALYYLSLRDYGSGELVSKLRRAGISRLLAEETVSSLADSGLIDDARYALLLAQDMTERKLYPKRRVAMALREKGFSSEIVDDVLLQLPSQEEQQALELLRKKRYNDLQEPAVCQKALAMLARNGFSYSAAKRAVEQLRAQRSSEDD